MPETTSAVFVVDLTVAAIFVSLQLAMLAGTAWLVAERIRFGERLTAVERDVAHHDKGLRLWETMVQQWFDGQARRKQRRRP